MKLTIATGAATAGLAMLLTVGTVMAGDFGDKVENHLDRKGTGSIAGSMPRATGSTIASTYAETASIVATTASAIAPKRQAGIGWQRAWIAGATASITISTAKAIVSMPAWIAVVRPSIGDWTDAASVSTAAGMRTMAIAGAKL